MHSDCTVLIVKSHKGCAPEYQLYDNEVGCYWPQLFLVYLSGVLQLQMLCTAGGQLAHLYFILQIVRKKSRPEASSAQRRKL